MLYEYTPPNYDIEEAIRNLRKEYAQRTLDESLVLSDPVRQFEGWFQEAIATQVPEANAMFLATCTPDAIPSGRIVLLKGISDGCFLFYTNYLSRKGVELTANPRAALTFFWQELERQVRIEGIVERLSETESFAYFATRPRGSRIGAWASPQSQPLPNRQALEQLFEQTAKRYETTDDIPLPPHWGGFRLIPHYFEFWQGRHSRLHDRIVYEKTSDGWNIGRIAP
jgi:pyridoxamine 5'-phosphate oxidase